MGGQPGLGVRVLMIEDSELALEVQVMLLERHGFEVQACRDLAELVNVPDSFKPHVVMTDVGLADATIEDACQRLREAYRGVPLLLFSGREDHELQALVADLGLAGFINKADDADVVVAKLMAASAAATR